MADESLTDTVIKGRKVRAETLTVAPEIMELNLAAPWKRLGAILIDLVVIMLLSLLSGPVLGIASGVLLVVLLGNKTPAPVALKLSRWICRGLGLVIVGLSVLALGHWSVTKSEVLNLDVLQGNQESAAMKQTVFVDANASYGQMRAAKDDLQQQVSALKKEMKEERVRSSSLLGRARSFTGALGVTFGWSGIYFTLITGLLNGRTLGKFLWRIRAVKINGTPFTFFDGFIRQGGYIAGVAMGMLGFVKLLWDPNRQAVEDRVAATVVVDV